MVDSILEFFGDHGERLLTIIANVVIIVSLGAYLAREFLSPLTRKLVLRSPVVAHFMITSSDRYDLKYAMQDDNEHFTKELVLPANTEDLLVHFNLIAKLDFTQTHLEIMFEGEKETKPLIHFYVLPYIKIGPPATPREKRPGEVPGHFIDYHDNYHIDEIRHKAQGQTTTYGFKISTRKKGIYKLTINISADGVEGAVSLPVRVEDPPSTIVRCTRREHWWGCYVKPQVARQ
jgi:hypothetical protein